MSIGGVLETDGRDEEALEVYRAAQKHVESLEEDKHPEVGLWHGVVGSALYHLGDHRAAFAEFVKAKAGRDRAAA